MWSEMNTLPAGMIFYEKREQPSHLRSMALPQTQVRNSQRCLLLCLSSHTIAPRQRGAFSQPILNFNCATITEVSANAIPHRLFTGYLPLSAHVCYRSSGRDPNHRSVANG